MDASQLTQKNQNQMIFAWYWDQRLFGTKPASATSFDIQIQRTLGGDISLERQLPILAPNGFTLDKMVLYCLDMIFSYVAQQNLGPTRTARFMYLWFFTLASGFHWVCPAGIITGTKDNWNWDTKYPLYSSEDIFVWMGYLLSDIMPTFLPSFQASSFVPKISESLGWTAGQAETKRQQIQNSSHYSDWKTAWGSWYSTRSQDGNVAAAAIPADSLLPNGSQTLEVTTTTDNPNTFTNPQKWVPLRINGSKKNYLTYGWGDVSSTILTSGNETTILNAAQEFFPGTADTYNDNSARAVEIADVVTTTGSLTDTQKMIAEFWAGGPGTVSPPGMCIWFWRWYIDSAFSLASSSANTLFFSGLELAIHLFETSRLVWNSKKTNIQARPLQEIRRMYRGQTLTNWDGTTISGEAWTPYQETNFVTPPFPDFPSGHSAFSQSFANVMTDWFGSQIPNISVTFTNLNLISPIFNESQTVPFGTFQIPAKRSQIQTGLVPSTALTFTYSSWQEMADEAGISRKYGGIHATSAHTSSQALANELHTILKSAWNIIIT